MLSHIQDFIVRPRKPKLSVMGGSFLPPGIHHERIVHAVSQELQPGDLLKILPCGIRPEPHKKHTRISPAIRAELCRGAFGHLLGLQVQLDLSDLESERFTPHIDLLLRLHRSYPDHEIWFVSGSDIFVGTSNGTGEILGWKEGLKVWRMLNFLVLTRPGFKLDPSDLPVHHELLEVCIQGSSSEIRRRLTVGESIKDLVSPTVEATIQNHRLWTGNMTQLTP
ncbi:MAG TPA: hypothetical protein VJB64_00375 [Patescibacteria group bacterium]|nr:hypothetical protein [Patescibacteria group bacterium]